MQSKNVTQLAYFVSLIPSALVITGNLNGGLLAGLNAFFALVILVILDWVMPEDTSHPEEVSDVLADFILVIHVVVQAISIGSLFYGISENILIGPFLFLAVFSTGINSGQSGIIVAHELIHRKSKFLKTLGIWNLLLVLYSHWYIEHKYGHHKWVGTFKDPATARYGESIYHFVIRTIPQQFVSAFNIEQQRHIIKGRNGINPRNFVVIGLLVQLGLLLAIFVILGSIYILAFVGQAIIAVILLEMVNYIEHYGLLRDVDQPFVKELAWNTDVISSRYFLLELTRHSDHHLRASKPYHTLLSFNDGAETCQVPTLPAGYWGVFFVTLFPKYWRKIIDPLIPQPMIDLFHDLTDQQQQHQIAGAGG